MKNKASLVVFVWIVFSFVFSATVSAQEESPVETIPPVPSSIRALSQPLSLIRAEMAQTGEFVTVVLNLENHTHLLHEAVVSLEWHPVNASGQYGEPIFVSRAEKLSTVRAGGEETIIETIALPMVLSGEVAVFARVESVVGQLYAKSFIGKLTLAGSATATISSCTVNKEPVQSGEAVTIPAGAYPAISCTVRNSSDKESRFTGEITFWRHGVLANVARANAVTLRAGASDTLNFSLPKNEAMKSGEFDGVITVLNASAKPASLPLPMTLVIGERGASILSLATDKAEYASGESAQVSVRLSMPFQGKTGLQVMTELTSKDGLCGRATAPFSSTQMQLALPVGRDCKEYSVKAALVDEAGYPLAERTIGQVDPAQPTATLTPEKGNMWKDWWKIIILALVLVPIFLFGWHTIKKRRMERMYMLFLPLVVAGVLFAYSAKAGTGTWYYEVSSYDMTCPFQGYPPTYVYSATGVMTTDKNTYAPGENVQLTVTFNSEDQPNDSFQYSIPSTSFPGDTLSTNGTVVYNFAAPAAAGTYNGVGNIRSLPPSDWPPTGGGGWVASGCPSWGVTNNDNGASQPLFTVVAGPPPCWKLNGTRTFSAASCTWPEPAPVGPPMPACTMGNQGQIEYRCMDDLPGLDLRLEMICSTCVGTVPTVTLTPQTASGPSLWKKVFAFLSQTKEVMAGGSVTMTVGGRATLSWATTNTSSCELTHTSPPPAIFPPHSVNPAGDSEDVLGLPVGTHVFTIVCTGPGGSAIDSATVVVNPPPGPPVISSFTNNGPIPWGTSAVLSWVTGNSTTCAIDNGIGSVTPVAAGSTTTLSLTTTTTYTLSCTNVNGTATAQTTVTVLPGPDYKICPASTLVPQGGTTALRSYYSASGPVDCGNTSASVDVTSSVTWNSSSPGVATVGNGGSSGVVTGVSPGSTTVSTTPYLFIPAAGVTITVPCIPSNSCASAGPSATASSLCPSETFTIDDGCGAPITCSGTRTCDFNWKEVAP